MNRIAIIALACMVALVCTQAYAQEIKVLFFEPALVPADTTFSMEPSGFSKLADMLRDDGMLVASMSSGSITQEKLSPYEIVVLHMNRERPLGETEISALVWFVAQKGGALFIHGGSAGVANPLTEIFGISIDASNLIDISSTLDEASGGRKFTLTRFPNISDFKLGDIRSIGFYGGSPLVLSRDAIALVTGDADCYSANGLFSIGSFPPVAAFTYLGRGMIVVKTDRAMLNNENIGMHQNMEWARAVFEGLSASRANELAREKSLFGLRARAKKLKNIARTCAGQLQKIETDLMISYSKTKDLQNQVTSLDDKNKNLTEKLNTTEKEIERLNSRLDRYEGPETLRMAALVTGVVLLVILLIGLFIGRKTVRSRV